MNKKNRVRVTAMGGLVLALAIPAASLIPATPASALTGFHIGGTWNVRNAASTSAGSYGQTTDGEAIDDLQCQLVAETVTVSGYGTSNIWDRGRIRLSNGNTVTGFWSDLGTKETAYAKRDSRLPDCGNTVTPPPPPASSVGEQAAQWAEARLGQVYTNENPNADHWSGWCEAFVGIAYGRRFRYPSADAHFNDYNNRGMIHGGPPPRGAIVFWTGHVAIGAGNGNVISTLGYNKARKPVSRVAYTSFPGYRGWAMPY